jgi:hypothetical protein
MREQLVPPFRRLESEERAYSFKPCADDAKSIEVEHDVTVLDPLFSGMITYVCFICWITCFSVSPIAMAYLGPWTEQPTVMRRVLVTHLLLGRENGDLGIHCRKMRQRKNGEAHCCPKVDVVIERVLVSDKSNFPRVRVRETSKAAV